MESVGAIVAQYRAGNVGVGTIAIDAVAVIAYGAMGDIGVGGVAVDTVGVVMIGTFDAVLVGVLDDKAIEDGGVYFVGGNDRCTNIISGKDSTFMYPVSLVAAGFVAREAAIDCDAVDEFKR